MCSVQAGKYKIIVADLHQDACFLMANALRIVWPEAEVIDSCEANSLRNTLQSKPDPDLILVDIQMLQLLAAWQLPEGVGNQSQSLLYSLHPDDEVTDDHINLQTKDLRRPQTLEGFLHLARQLKRSV